MTVAPQQSGVLRGIAVAVQDTAAAERLLGRVTDLPVTVRDGDRWTALEAGGLTVALTVTEELPGGAAVSLNVKVADVAAAHEELIAAGALSVMAPALTAHEERAAVRLGDSVVLSVYRSLPRQA
ncbi:VOC family protein [Streptosporangium amethystogenes subsp. fukuiense]|uniref:VOC family protein n=1 Tax=Streptosporangium amethystogenes subsp. fukuiense TaxID=698418 RepID=A0ABW2SZQ4_9ACTN